MHRREPRGRGTVVELQRGTVERGPHQLDQLAEEIGKVIDKNRLAEQSMQRSLTLFDRSLDMHLSNLRKKLGNAPDGNPRIKTIRGVGYMYMTADA